MNAAQHYARLLDMPCMVTGQRPVSRHHIVGGSALLRMGVRGGRKHSDWLAIPLIDRLHQGADGVHTIGVVAWEACYGKQVDMIEALGHQLGLDLWALAKQEAADERANRRAKPFKKRSKAYVPPKKQVPR